MRLLGFLAVAVGVLAAGCASHPAPRQSARCEQEWHPAIAMLLRYADKDGNVTRAGIEAGLKKDFDAADTNHDGVLEPNEVRAVNEKRWDEDKAATSPLVDVSGRGVIDFDEFAGTARSLFDELDVKGTGVLTAAQLHPPCGAGAQQPSPSVEHRTGGHRGRRGGDGD